MKKNNWIVYIIALIASAFLLWLWYWLGFDHVDAPFDLALSIAWWVIIAVACFGIHRIEEKRRERVRTCYQLDGMLYNSEAGLRSVATDNADETVKAMHDTIEGLEYGLDIQDRPEDPQGNEIPFTYIVRSKKFKVEQNAGAQAGSHETLDWQGEVAVVARPNDDPVPFENADELLAIMRRLVGSPAAPAPALQRA